MEGQGGWWGEAGSRRDREEAFPVCRAWGLTGCVKLCEKHPSLLRGRRLDRLTWRGGPGPVSSLAGREAGRAQPLDALGREL